MFISFKTSFNFTEIYVEEASGGLGINSAFKLHQDLVSLSYENLKQTTEGPAAFVCFLLVGNI